MKLRCTIGSQGFVGGPTYRVGDEYTMDDVEKAKQLIEQGYAEEIQEMNSPALVPPLLKLNETAITKKPKTRKKY